MELRLTEHAARLGRRDDTDCTILAVMTREEVLHLIDVLGMSPADPRGQTESLLCKLAEFVRTSWRGE